METLQDLLHAKLNYWVYVILMMIGLFAMITKNNLIKKLIGMSIFQAAIILFYVSTGVKTDAKVPIVIHGHGDAGESHASAGPPDPDRYANPLPHVLMLTAIVVSVSTLGVGLAIAQKIHREFGTLEENEILEQINSSDG